MTDFIVSARKYRPDNFDAVVGQSSVTSTLKNAIQSNQLAQSYLFCGPRGVGKTTCARIFAKEVNQFENENQVDDFSFNIFELDAASNNSVDDIRNLTDQVRVPPQIGKYKVYIIDEVHMLSTSAFNAFLKTLEEPPKHAKFILATTEKHKIIPTILSRCQIFDFKRISENDIALHLEKIAKEEEVTVEEDALHLIAQKSDGSLRDSLSLFDRLISFSDKNLTYSSVVEHLNILDYEYYFKITDCLLENDINQLLNIYNEILENGFDGNHFINGLAEHLRDLLVSKDESTIKLLKKSETLRLRYLDQSKKCKISFLLEALNLCNECDVKYKTTNNQRLLVELILMRIASIDVTSQEKKKDKTFVVNEIKKPVEQEKKNNKKEENPVVNADEEEKNKVENNQVVEDKVENIASKPKIKLDLDNGDRKSSLISINSSLQEEAKEAETITADIRVKDFSQEMLLKEWKNLTLHIKEKGKLNIGISLGVNEPKLLENFLIEFPLSNAAQEEMIAEEKYEILDYLRNKLENDKIDLKTIIIEGEKNSTPYTNKDKFKKMLSDNPNLEKLRVKLGLDPDY